MNIRSLGGVTVEIQSEKDFLVLEAEKEYDNASVITTSKDGVIKNPKIRIFSWPGEYEVGNWLFHGIEADNETVVFQIRIEGIHVVHLGKAKELTPELLDKIDNIDVLILPIEEGYLTADEAKAIIVKLEPRIIIPVGEITSHFIELMGIGSEAQPQAKVKITQASLPMDKTEVVQLIQ